MSAGRSCRLRALARRWRLQKLGIAARSATVSAVAVMIALTLAGAILDVALYRYLLAGVDDATQAEFAALPSR